MSTSPSSSPISGLINPTKIRCFALRTRMPSWITECTNEESPSPLTKLQVYLIREELGKESFLIFYINRSAPGRRSFNIYRCEDWIYATGESYSMETTLNTFGFNMILPFLWASALSLFRLGRHGIHIFQLTVSSFDMNKDTISWVFQRRIA